MMGKKLFKYTLKKMSKLEIKMHKLGCDLKQQGLSTDDILANAIGLLVEEIDKINRKLKI